MTSTTVHTLVHRPRTAAPAPAEVPVESPHRPTNELPGPDEGSLARTTAAVVTSLVLLIGTMVLLSVGVGTVVTAVAEWSLSR